MKYMVFIMYYLFVLAIVAVIIWLIEFKNKSLWWLLLLTLTQISPKFETTK